MESFNKKEFTLEEVFPNSAARPKKEYFDEKLAEEALDELLADPENAFLTKVEQNRVLIEEAKTYAEAVEIAQKRIRERLVATLKAKKMTGKYLEGVEVNPDSILNAIEHIKSHQKVIGIGADGVVVIDTTDERNLNPDICYKFALEEKVKRGRNSMTEEVELQGAFYDLAENFENKDIGVPMPMYEVEVFSTQMIAMEKLHAKSVDDILNGRAASLPEWLDVDRFCDSVEEFLRHAHSNHLYHRDLHFGNIMISQDRNWEEGDPIGFIIDFGLSSYGFEDMDPYRKEIADSVFTFDDDCGRISGMRQELKSLKGRNHAH